MSAKGLDISLAALQRQDPYIKNIVDVASQVALYTFNNRANEWEKTEVEGALFVYTRLASPRHGFTIMNRLSMKNLTEPITKDLDFQLQHPFLLYRNARFVIHGIWFYDKEDCRRIAQRMKTLTQLEQALAQPQVKCLSHEGGGGEAKTVDIIKMLTNARTDYEKAQPTPEPKEISGSNVLCRNPNLIKPIPVKPNTQDSDYAEPRGLSLATLFGFQKDQQSARPDPVSPLATPLEASSPGLVRPPAARTLTYDDALNPNREVGNAATARSPGRGQAAVTGAQALREVGGNVVAGLVQSSGATQHQRDQDEPQQHCPAIQKLMQGQRAVGGGVGVLQTVSESPENRLCDNGAPVEHHPHPLVPPHHHHHQHHQQQLQLDPIKSLFQTPLVFPSSTLLPSAALLSCSTSSLQPGVTCQPIALDSVPPSLFQAQQRHQSSFEPSRPPTESQHNRLALTLEDKGWPAQIPGVVSPHELLQKLRLVQHEQRESPSDPLRPSPGLAPRFAGPTQGLAERPTPDRSTTAPREKPERQIPMIPATPGPNPLLSPNVFTQAKTCPGLTGAATGRSLLFPKLPVQPEVPVLSRSQLQATLLSLIKSDSSFLDTIYEAYISRFANSTSSKY
ncbi:mRNA-decapping enzyme 1B isoform X1 [Takifugu rubripes]|uniref:5'-(N(7)-methylguanosine 5'-triphospho)-[mRNA] hydrolase n=1 Tax=Takifugu rubripes TaxID=31033 RepID=H2UYB5_TAKRU|nr:mRNA-decapping enzyme 1B isoform X1 [Takifugu rubripes]|eukprot:XP_011611684.1 PREDICTED: mRNA-decapping enzyme 1B [Takifugu rubripes]